MQHMCYYFRFVCRPLILDVGSFPLGKYFSAILLLNTEIGVEKRIYIINMYGDNLKFYEWNGAQFTNQYMPAEASSILLQSTIDNKSEHIFRFVETI